MANGYLPGNTHEEKRHKGQTILWGKRRSKKNIKSGVGRP